MDSPLFRPEVSQARQARWLGTIALGQPWPLWVLAACAIAAATGVVAFVTSAEYTRRTRVVGQLVPRDGIATVVAPVAGTLRELRVDEGDVVRAGERLAVIAVPRVTRRDGDTGRVQQAALAARAAAIAASYAAQRHQLDAQRAGLVTQLASVDAELRQIAAELATRREQQRLLDATLARFAELHARGFVTETELQQRQGAALEQRGLVQALQRQALVLGRQQAQLQQTRHELPAREQGLLAAERREAAALAQEAAETAARGEAVLQAPVAGVVAVRLVQPGQAVQAGQALLSLLPADATLEAQLTVPSRAVGFVATGDRVLMRYQAFPYQKFGQHPGVVVRVARSALAAEGAGGEPVYRVVVAPASPTVRAFGHDEPLKPGMVLEADLLGERRRLWEWLLEPAFALDGAVATDEG
jgi:membrane fusion protein